MDAGFKIVLIEILVGNLALPQFQKDLFLLLVSILRLNLKNQASESQWNKDSISTYQKFFLK